MRRLILTVCLVVWSPACLLLFAQEISPVVDSLDVDSTAADAVDVAGGIVLGIDLLPDHGGVPERTVIFYSGATCPPPLVLFPHSVSGIGTLIACLYSPGSGSAQLGSAQLGSARLQ